MWHWRKRIAQRRRLKPDGNVSNHPHSSIWNYLSKKAKKQHGIRASVCNKHPCIQRDTKWCLKKLMEKNNSRLFPVIYLDSSSSRTWSKSPHSLVWLAHTSSFLKSTVSKVGQGWLYREDTRRLPLHRRSKLTLTVYIPRIQWYKKAILPRSLFFS